MLQPPLLLPCTCLRCAWLHWQLHKGLLLRPSPVAVQEWARAENDYADRHGPQEELLTTEDLAGLNQLDTEPSRLSTSSITGILGMQHRVRVWPVLCLGSRQAGQTCTAHNAAFV